MRYLILMTALVTGACNAPSEKSPSVDADVVIVGAGISGVSAALEAARGGASVLVVDMWSIFGGHAVMSHGGLCIVDTPVQKAQGVSDSAELAEKDFLTWGEDADAEWVRYYTENSREQIYDWVTEMGVEFSGVLRIPGNSVARFHEPIGRGLGLVSPIYRQAVLHPKIRFVWNFKVDGLVTKDSRVVGVDGAYLRGGERASFRGELVVLATGGFQSNLDIVREYWPEAVRFPEKMLAGSGVNSHGSGLAIAEQAGAALRNLDHQWNYATGLPDPRYPGGYRGLNASNNGSIWVNAMAERFVNEQGSTKEKFPALLAQEPARYWAIFDESSKRQFAITGSDWADFDVIEQVIFENDEIVQSADSLEALGEAAGLPPRALVATVTRYNEMIDEGSDNAFGRFDSDSRARPSRIETPPFYSVTFFPLSRKSMGGIAIDIDARVLDKSGEPIAGLLAVGEATGFGGINGKAGLEGTFLGPSIVTGRVAGRTILKELADSRTMTPSVETQNPGLPQDAVAGEDCAACHDLPGLIEDPRPGYTHFENVHRVVLERQYDCGRCHAEMLPIDLDRHVIDRVAQIESCKSCHVSTEF